MISFGPYVTRVGSPEPYGREVERTGCKLEFASAGIGFEFMLYRRICSWKRELPDIHNLLLHEAEVPVDISYFECFSVENEHGVFVPLESVLSSLYSSGSVSLPITSFLEELHSFVPFTDGFHQRCAHGIKLVDERLASRGIEAGQAFSYGRTVMVPLVWVPSSARDTGDGAAAAYLAGVEFRPRPDRTLGRGKWLEPKEWTLASSTTKFLRKMFKRSAAGVLSEAGQHYVLDSFEWNELSRMTSREARSARVAFAKTHTNLHGKPRDLAVALKQAGLYAESTSISQIIKHLSPIIARAQED